MTTMLFHFLICLFICYVNFVECKTDSGSLSADTSTTDVTTVQITNVFKWPPQWWIGAATLSSMDTTTDSTTDSTSSSSSTTTTTTEKTTVITTKENTTPTTATTMSETVISTVQPDTSTTTSVTTTASRPTSTTYLNSTEETITTILSSKNTKILETTTSTVDTTSTRITSTVETTTNNAATDTAMSETSTSKTTSKSTTVAPASTTQTTTNLSTKETTDTATTKTSLTSNGTTSAVASTTDKEYSTVLAFIATTAKKTPSVTSSSSNTVSPMISSTTVKPSSTSSTDKTSTQLTTKASSATTHVSSSSMLSQTSPKVSTVASTSQATTTQQQSSTASSTSAATTATTSITNQTTTKTSAINTTVGVASTTATTVLLSSATAATTKATVVAANSTSSATQALTVTTIITKVATTTPKATTTTTEPAPDGSCYLPAINTTVSKFMINYPSPVGVNSTIGVDCLEKLVWQNNYKRFVFTCTATGTWEPNISNIDCGEYNPLITTTTTTTPEPPAADHCNLPIIDTINMKFMVTYPSEVALNSTVGVDCLNGLVRPNQYTRFVFTCTSTGTWEPDPSTMECGPKNASITTTAAPVTQAPPDGYCNLPTIDTINSKYMVNYPNQVAVNSTVGVDCLNGLVWPNQYTRYIFTCTATGTWEPDSSTLQCGLVNASITTTTSTTIMSTTGKRATTLVATTATNSTVAKTTTTISKAKTAVTTTKSSANINCSLFTINSTFSYFDKNYTSTLAINSTVVVDCVDGSLFSDNSVQKTFICSVNGTWAPTVESCKAISSSSTTIKVQTAATTTQSGFCDLFSINNSTSYFESTYPNVVATGSSIAVKCNSSSTFSNGLTRKIFGCLSNGTWSPDPTTNVCTLKTTTSSIEIATTPGYCLLFDIDTTVSSFENRNNFSAVSAGSSIAVNCKNNAKYPNGLTRQIYVCYANGSWSPSSDNYYCTLFVAATTMTTTTKVTTTKPVATCSLFYINQTTSSFQQNYTSAISANETVTVVCKNGFMFSDLSSIRIYECLNNGTWVDDPTADGCTETVATCETPTLILTNSVQPSSTSSVFYNNSEVGTQIYHICKSSYVFQTGQPLNIYQCLGDGSWSNNLAENQTCQKMM